MPGSQKKTFLISTIKKSIIIATVVIGSGQPTIGKSVDSTQLIPRKKNQDCSPTSVNSQTINPVVITILKKTFSNLDKTVNTGKGFDYWPKGGIQIAYYHLATFVSYEMISHLSPEPVFVSGPHGAINFNLNSSQTFGHYNSKFIQWFQDHLIEMLEDQSFVESTTKNFQTYLGDTAKTYWATYTILNQYPNELNTLLEDYKTRLETRSLPDGYYYNIAWSDHADRFNSLKELHASYDTNVVSPAVYFWLRRYLDGTEDRFFSMLEHLLVTYQIKQPERVYYDSEELPINR